MCEPVTMTLLAVATAGVSLYAQQQTAQAQADALNVQAENARKETLSKSEEELGQRVRAARESRERARVAAGESGAMGASFAASINQSIQDQDYDAALIQKNVAFAQRANEDRLNTALAGIRSPSALEAGLTIATAGLSGYSAGLGLKAKRSKGTT